MALDYKETDIDNILLGDGELYLGILPDGTDPETALSTVIDDALKNIGIIESGATLNIDKKMKDLKSNRGIVGRYTTETNTSFKSGVLSWNINDLNSLLGATVTTDGTSKKTVVGANDRLPVVYLRFIHTKADGGTLTVNMYRAQAEGKLDFKFDREKHTTINYEFMALASSAGNYVEILETFPVEA